MLKGKKQLAWLLLSVLIIVSDQLTKAWVLQHFIPYVAHPILPFINLTLAFNEGAAFSFLSDAGGWQRWGLGVISLVVCVVLSVWLYRTPIRAKWTSSALALVIGGALANLYDRVTLGYVVDFIDVYYRQWHWPIFNIADSAISIGVVILILASFKSHSAKS